MFSRTTCCASTNLFIPTDNNSFPHTVYSFARTIIRSHGQFIFLTNNYSFAQTIRCMWERTFVRLHGQLFVSMDNYSLTWTIRCLHHSRFITMTSYYSVSNHQPHGCLLNRLFRRRWKKTSKLRVTGLCVGNSQGPVNSPHKGPVTRKMFPFDDVIMWYRCPTPVLFCGHRRSPLTY